jgi:hypothetical protein
MPDAVCCEDKVHCCPKDTTCDVAAGACRSKLVRTVNLEMTKCSKSRQGRGARVKEARFYLLVGIYRTLNNEMAKCSKSR